MTWAGNLSDKSMGARPLHAATSIVSPPIETETTYPGAHRPGLNRHFPLSTVIQHHSGGEVTAVGIGIVPLQRLTSTHTRTHTRMKEPSEDQDKSSTGERHKEGVDELGTKTRSDTEGSEARPAGGRKAKNSHSVRSMLSAVPG